jgi:hypothetical protein
LQVADMSLVDSVNPELLERVGESEHRDQRHQTNGLTVRVIEYTLDEPHRTGHGERQRLVTTLLDATVYPAEELVVLYHQQWEIEIVSDELNTHQLHRQVHLQSRTPRASGRRSTASCRPTTPSVSCVTKRLFRRASIRGA